MAFEKEIVLNVRHRIQMHEQEQIFNENVPGEPDDAAARFNNPHIHLGSRQRSLKVPSYEQVLEAELGFLGFGDSLARFFRDQVRIEVYGSDFEGDGFEGHQLCINWCKVSLILSQPHRVKL